jgi:hypothetical protein
MSEPTKQFNIRLPEEQVVQIAREAEANNITQAAVIDAAVQVHMARPAMERQAYYRLTKRQARKTRLDRNFVKSCNKEGQHHD